MSDVRTVDDNALADAKEIIARGGIVALPTDTVYGIACDPTNAEAIERIYAAKRRPKFKPLQILMASVNDLDALRLRLPAPLNRLAIRFLPGAFSPIAVAEDDCALQTISRTPEGHMTQGIRVPNSAVCLRILRATGPLACSSANRSGEQSAQSVEEAVAAFGDDVDMYLDGGPTLGHIASTVVAADPLERDGIHIIREGMIPATTIHEALHVNAGGFGA